MNGRGVKTPAAQVIEAFGGVRPTARVLELNPSTVCRWQKPKEQRGSGGLIPSEHHARILRESRARQLPLTAESLIAAG